MATPASTDTLIVPADMKDAQAPLSPEKVTLRNDALLPIAQTLGERVTELRAQGVNVTDETVTRAAERLASMPLYVGANANESNEPLKSFVATNLLTVDGKNASLNSSGLDALEVAIKNISSKVPDANQAEPAPAAPVNVNSNNTAIDNSTNTTVVETKKDEPPAQPVQINATSNTVTANTTENNIDNSTTVIETKKDEPPAQPVQINNTSVTATNTETNVDNSTNTTLIQTPPVSQGSNEPAPQANATVAAAETTIENSPNATVIQTPVVVQADNSRKEEPSAPQTSAALAAAAVDIDNSPNATVHQTVIVHRHDEPAPATPAPAADTQPAQTSAADAQASETKASEAKADEATRRSIQETLTAPSPKTVTMADEVHTDEFVQSNGGSNFKIGGLVLAGMAALSVVALGSFTVVAGAMLAAAAVSYGFGKLKELHDRATAPVESEVKVTHTPVVVDGPSPDLAQNDLGRKDGKSWADVTPKQSPAEVVTQRSEDKSWTQQATQEQAAAAQASARA